jgi:hypothetical protein
LNDTPETARKITLPVIVNLAVVDRTTERSGTDRKSPESAILPQRQTLNQNFARRKSYPAGSNRIVPSKTPGIPASDDQSAALGRTGQAPGHQRRRVGGMKDMVKGRRVSAAEPATPSPLTLFNPPITVPKKCLDAASDFSKPS